MVRVKYTTSKGQCASMSGTSDCTALRGNDHIEMVKSGKCGTFQCPFYKPAELQGLGWVRIDKQDEVLLIPPEEYDKEYARHVEEQREAEED